MKARKIIAVALALLLLPVGAALIKPQTASAAENVEYLTEDAAAAKLAECGKSLVAGKIPTFYSNLINGDKDDEHKTFDCCEPTDGYGSAKNITDGKFDNYAYLSGSAVPEDRTIQADVVFDFGCSVTVSKLFLTSLKNNQIGYMGAFDVYLGDSDGSSSKNDPLFSEENKIFSYNYKDSGINFGLIATIDGEKSGRYIAIRVTRATAAYDQQIDGQNVRPDLAGYISEFAVYGECNLNYTPFSVDSQEYPDKSKTNLLLNKDVKFYLNERYVKSDDSDDNHTVYTPWDDTQNGEKTSLPQFMYDNKLTTICYLTDTTGEKSVKRSDVVFDLGGKYTINGFLLAGQGNKEPFGLRYPGKYEVYVGDSDGSSSENDPLFSQDNLIFSYDSDTAAGMSFGQNVDKTIEKSGRYLAVRVTVPSAIDYTNIFGAISEIAAYGTVYHDPYESFESTAQVSDFGSSLIYGKIPTVFSNKRDDGSEKREDITEAIQKLKPNNTTLENLTDGDLTKKSDIGDGYDSGKRVVSADIQFDLGATANLTGFIYCGQYDSEEGKGYPGKYEVYVAETIENLYKPETLVFTYDPALGSSFGQHASFEKPVSGRYFAIRTLTPNAGAEEAWQNTFSRIGEIGVFGEYDVVESLETGSKTGDEELNNDLGVFGAQIRESDKAFRFVMHVNSNTLETLKAIYGEENVELGTVLVNADAFGGGTLEVTEKTTGFGGANPTTVKNTSPFTPDTFKDTKYEAHKVYTVVITGVTEDKQSTNVAVRAYIKYTDAYGTPHVLYSQDSAVHGGYQTTYSAVETAAAEIIGG